MTGPPPAAVAFGAHAAEYTALRRRLVPRFEPFYAAAVEALALPGVRPIHHVLDLGAGTGLLSALVTETLPQVCLDLLDGSEEMLAEARERLAEVIESVHVQDMADPLPPGPYDAVISALAIHHLEDDQKRDLFRRVWAVLSPAGVFVNAEQTGGPTESLADLYRRRWAEEVLAQGGSVVELDAATERRRLDRCASVESQLAWLREAGFTDVDCTYKYWETAVLVAVKGHLG